MFFTICLTAVIAFFAGFLARGGTEKINYYRRAQHFNECLDAARAEGVESGKVIGWREATQYHDAANDSDVPYYFKDINAPWGWGYAAKPPSSPMCRSVVEPVELTQEQQYLEQCLKASEVNLPPFLN